MLIRAYADLHGFLPHIEPCDALLLAGDTCPIEGEFGDHEPMTQARWLREVFNPWVDAQPVERVVLIGGNHDAILDRVYSQGLPYELHEKITYLLDSGTRIGETGPRVWGSPWTPELVEWPFYKTHFGLREIAAAMPRDYEIWLLHSPPASSAHGYRLDYAKNGEHAGNPFTTLRLAELKPQLVICGHIHEGYGIAGLHESNIANAAFLDQGYQVRWRHIEIEWNEDDQAVWHVRLAQDDPERGLWWSCLGESGAG